MDAEIEEPSDHLDQGNKVRANQEEKDVMVNLGDEACYFTINKEPTIL
jgi:hypothetical protein